MCSKVAILLLLFAVSAVADSGLFPYIHIKDSIRLVLPNAECETKVVGRGMDRLTLRLKGNTATCGRHGSEVELSRADVRDVSRKRHRREGDPAVCAGLAFAFVGAPVGQYFGEKYESNAATLGAAVGSVLAGAPLCRDRSGRYTVTADRIHSGRP